MSKVFPPSFSAAYASYSRALSMLCDSKGAEKGPGLKMLDEWMFGDFAQSARKNGKMTSDELARVMEWKLSRGKFRPTLMALVKGNSSSAVESISKSAFEKVGKNDVVEAVKTLSELKGVGPATASAILSAHSPSVPFMSDESLSVFFPANKLPYTLPAFKTLLDMLQKKANELNKEDTTGDWTAGKCERAIWAWSTIERLERAPKAKDVVETNPSKQTEPVPKGDSSEKKESSGAKNNKRKPAAKVEGELEIAAIETTARRSKRIKAQVAM
ncbi:hypothetical protein PhCBS80983_g00833 [Powellomyces hirtus]|uniref:Uncharacterized protein n=1 Tax=Powellomyces hirtus TaxID=109895 RepID=A0A507EEW9_9FUNG|nr:hypothetical protein PhCBS80983_g00833 [Powellomyces hirtus]